VWRLIVIDQVSHRTIESDASDGEEQTAYVVWVAPTSGVGQLVYV
jgi:hypothetical protein